MASLWTRITGKTEKRALQPTIPSRAATVVTPDAALSLTAVYRACQIIATPISKMTVETYRYASGVGDLKIENPLLVNKPSLYDSRRDFFFQTVVSLATDGNAFWHKEFDSRGNVNNLTILPASSVSVTWNEAKTAKIYNYAGSDITGRVEHLKLFSKVGDLRGVSPIASCYRDIAAALDLRDYAANWFSSAGVPTGIIKSNRIITKDEAVEMTANWHNKQQNRQTAVLGSGGLLRDRSVVTKRRALYRRAEPGRSGNRATYGNPGATLAYFDSWRLGHLHQSPRREPSFLPSHTHGLHRSNCRRSKQLFATRHPSRI